MYLAGIWSFWLMFVFTPTRGSEVQFLPSRLHFYAPKIGQTPSQPQDFKIKLNKNIFCTNQGSRLLWARLGTEIMLLDLLVSNIEHVIKHIDVSLSTLLKPFNTHTHIVTRHGPDLIKIWPWNCVEMTVVGMVPSMNSSHGPVWSPFARRYSYHLVMTNIAMENPL